MSNYYNNKHPISRYSTNNNNSRSNYGYDDTDWSVNPKSGPRTGSDYRGYSGGGYRNSDGGDEDSSYSESNGGDDDESDNDNNGPTDSDGASESEDDANPGSFRGDNRRQGRYDVRDEDVGYRSGGPTSRGQGRTDADRVNMRGGQRSDPYYRSQYSGGGPGFSKSRPGTPNAPSLPDRRVSSSPSGEVSLGYANYRTNSCAPSRVGSPHGIANRGYNASSRDQSLPLGLGEGFQDPPEPDRNPWSNGSTNDLLERFLASAEYVSDLFGVQAAGNEQWGSSSPDTTNFASSMAYDVPTPTQLSEVSRAQRAKVRRGRALKGAQRAAGLGEARLEEFLTTKGDGLSFKLVAKEDTRVPFQRCRIGPKAIPDKLADTQYTQMNPATVLHHLNDILGTPNRVLDEPGMVEVLQMFIDEELDFGQIYGYLRPWWPSIPIAEVPLALRRRKCEDKVMRQEALNSECIKDARVPPRRVWDLYSNRVLPYHALNVSEPKSIHDKLCTVSHAWLLPSERKQVTTPINAKLWRVPIPQTTTLEHIRIELLNYGAEYAFLDVLCLRQTDKPSFEYKRKQEWRLDIPTIGYVYLANGVQQTTVIYFNGLGCPFTASFNAIKSQQHWLNRVWTIQEATTSFIVGGDTGMRTPAQQNVLDSAFVPVFQRLHPIILLPPRELELKMIVDIVRERASTKEVDRVLSMAYLLRCTSLPLYNEDASAEDTWDCLVEHMPPRLRTDLLVTWFVPGDDDGKFSWRPTWVQLMNYQLYELPCRAPYAQSELLSYTSEGCLDGSDGYYHAAYFIPRCLITDSQDKGEPCRVVIPHPSGSSFDITSAGQFSSINSRGNPYPYCLVGVRGGEVWIVGQCRGKANVDMLDAIVVEKQGAIFVGAAKGNAMLNNFVSNRATTVIMYI